MSYWGSDLEPPYTTLVADPPWAYPEGFVTVDGDGKTIRYPLPYSSMTVEEIAAMPVRELAAADARLFLWVTNKYLPDVFDIARAWGFRFKQMITWHKPDGFGGSLAPNSEFLVVAVRGAPPRTGRFPAAVVTHNHMSVHSAKPPCFGDLIEACSPGPYVELFARNPRLGWSAWGFGYESRPALEPEEVAEADLADLEVDPPEAGLQAEALGLEPLEPAAEQLTLL